MKENTTIELTPEELIQLLNTRDETTIINVIFEAEGGDQDAGREQV